MACTSSMRWKRLPYVRGAAARRERLKVCYSRPKDNEALLKSVERGCAHYVDKSAAWKSDKGNISHLIVRLLAPRFAQSDCAALQKLWTYEWLARKGRAKKRRAAGGEYGIRLSDWDR